MELWIRWVFMKVQSIVESYNSGVTFRMRTQSLGWLCHLWSHCKYGKSAQKFSIASLYFLCNIATQVLNPGGCKSWTILVLAAAFSYSQPSRLYLPEIRMSHERDREASARLPITRNCVDLCITVPYVLSFACPFWPSSLIFDPVTKSSRLLLAFPSKISFLPWQVMVCVMWLLGDPFVPQPNKHDSPSFLSHSSTTFLSLNFRSVVCSSTLSSSNPSEIAKGWKAPFPYTWDM